MVTYFAVTDMGTLLNDEIISVRPGAGTEARAVAALSKALREHDGGDVRPPLKLYRSRGDAPSSSPPASLSLHRVL